MMNPTETNKIHHIGVVHDLLELENSLPRHLHVPRGWKAAREGEKRGAGGDKGGSRNTDISDCYE